MIKERFFRFLFYVAGAISLFLLVLETILWAKYGGTEICGAGLTYLICGRGRILFAQIPDRVTWFTLYSWIMVEPWAICSLVLVTAIFFSLAVLGPKRGFVIAFVAYQLAIFSWTVTLADSLHTTSLLESFKWFLPYQTMLEEGFLGQDLTTILFFVILALASYRTFNPGIATMISSASLAVLPLSIYFFDQGEFIIHAEGQFQSLSWVTNAVLLRACEYTFLIGSGLAFGEYLFLRQHRQKSIRSML